MPPKSLAAPLAADIVSGEELTEDAAVGQAADAITALGELGHLEAPGPRPLVPVADIDLGPRGKGGPRVRIRCRPPSAHTTIVLTMTGRW